MYQDDPYHESRELIELEEDQTTYYQYCFCVKSLVEARECRCRYFLLGGCALPFLIIADTVAFVPQLLINNIKLCLK